MARMDGARGGNREKERPISDFEFASAGQICGVITLQKTEKNHSGICYESDFSDMKAHSIERGEEEGDADD